MNTISRPAKIAIYVFLSLIALVCVLSFLVVVSVSFSAESDITMSGYRLLPKNFTLDAYRVVFENPQQIFTGYKISILITAIGTLVSVAIMSMCAYCLARDNFRYRKIITMFIFFTMLFSGGLVPTYILITQYLHLNDSFGILILTGLVNPFYLIILRTFFKDLPASLFEAAKIDGASEFRIFTSIAVQISKPAIATVSLMMALARWNDWYTPMLYITNKALYPLQLILYHTIADLEFISANMSNLPQSFLETISLPMETTRMAMCIIAAGPMLFVFPFFQKYFVAGLTVGSIKE